MMSVTESSRPLNWHQLLVTNFSYWNCNNIVSLTGTSSTSLQMLSLHFNNDLHSLRKMVCWSLSLPFTDRRCPPHSFQSLHWTTHNLPVVRVGSTEHVRAVIYHHSFHFNKLYIRLIKFYLLLSGATMLGNQKRFT